MNRPAGSVERNPARGHAPGLYLAKAASGSYFLAPMRQTLETKLKSWFIAPSSGVHLNLADGLRGVAILLVVCCHGFYYNPAGSNVVAAVVKFIQTGWMGVRLFFVLSGFLIALPFFQGRAKDPGFWRVRGYAMRRALKIFPPFYVVTAALTCFYLLVHRDWAYARAGLAWASGVAHFVPLPINFNLSFWSLWVEAGFYVVLPFLFLATRGLSLKATGWVVAGGLFLIPLAVRSIVWQGGLESGVSVIVNNRFPCALDNFAWGVGFAAFYVSAASERARWKWLGLLGWAGVLLLAASGLWFSMAPDWVAAGKLPSRLEGELEHFLPGLSSLLMLCLIFDPQSALARFFSASWLRFLGLVSFEWFLIHQPMQSYFRAWMGSSAGNPLLYLVKVGVPSLTALALAVALYQALSLPILRWGRERSRAAASRLVAEPSAQAR